MKFDFITDDSFREILERDFQELGSCIETKSAKSALILSGSIIEAVLTDYFITFPKDGITKKKVLGMDLYPLIELAAEEKLISQSTKELSTVIKNYRNLIHPGREIRKSVSFDFDTAVVAKSLLNIILKEIKENYLSNIGYTAKDVLAKLSNDALSQPIFEILLNKIHKTEKVKLYNELIENQLDTTGFVLEIDDPKKYIRILKSHVDRAVVEVQLRKIIHKIETGNKWEILTYYRLLYEDIGFLKPNEIELILLYVLNTLNDATKNVEKLEEYDGMKLFSTFGTQLTTDGLKTEFLNLICSLVKRHQTNKDYVYFYAYDHLVNSVSADRKQKIKDYVVANVSVNAHTKFYKGYNDGDFLPF